MSESATRVREGGGRIAWIDLGRGFIVFLVVLFHCKLWYFDEIGGPAAPHETWSLATRYTSAIRMPLLLVLSGILAASKVRKGARGWRAAVTSYYLYAVWLCIYATMAFIVRADYPHRIESAGDLLSQFIVPDTTLWYLYALAFYSATLTSVRKFSPWLILTALALISIITSATIDEFFWARILELWVYYGVGVYGRASILDLANSRRGTGLAVGLVLLAAGASIQLTLGGDDYGHAAARFVQDIGVIIGGVSALAILAHWKPLADIGGFVGRRTLGVYVIHPLIIGLLLTSGSTHGGSLVSHVESNAALGYPFPLAVAIAVTAMALVFTEVLKRSGADFLFDAPPVLRRWLERHF